MDKNNERASHHFLLDLPETLHIHSNETLHVKCTLTGASWRYPSPMWLKDDHPIIVKSSRIIISYDGKTSSLRILTCSPADGGVYTVRFTDSQERIETSCSVHIDIKQEVTTMSEEIDFNTCEDEEKLMALMNKTDDMKKRKEIRLRLKEIRDKEMKLVEERQKQRAATGNVDSVKLRAEQANKDKERQMKTYQKIAANSSMAHSFDPVKASSERSQQEKANQMKMMEELAKAGGGPGEYQHGCERMKQIDMEYNDKLAARMYQQFDDLHVNDYLQREKAAHIMANVNNGEGKSQPINQNKGLVRSGTQIKQNLLNWVQLQVKDYKGVEVKNFSSSWANGLAFCALIHHFHPESFQFEQLEADNRRENFQLAFDTAETHGVSPLLEVDDMVRMRIPDYQCVFTYVQSIYRQFRTSELCNS